MHIWNIESWNLSLSRRAWGGSQRACCYILASALVKILIEMGLGWGGYTCNILTHLGVSSLLLATYISACWCWPCQKGSSHHFVRRSVSRKLMKKKSEREEKKREGESRPLNAVKSEKASSVSTAGGWGRRREREEEARRDLTFLRLSLMLCPPASHSLLPTPHLCLREKKKKEKEAQWHQASWEEKKRQYVSSVCLSLGSGHLSPQWEISQRRESCSLYICLMINAWNETFYMYIIENRKPLWKWKSSHLMHEERKKQYQILSSSSSDISALYKVKKIYFRKAVKAAVGRFCTAHMPSLCLWL